LGWAERLGVVLDESWIQYRASILLDVEGRSIGRLATTARDAVFRTIAVESVLPIDPRVLEIGTLFGVNACFLEEVIGFGLGEPLHQTLIDPFAGYYGGGLDPSTGASVNELAVRHNLVRTGLTEADYDIIVGFSREPQVIAAAAVRRYGAILIDGDHSFGGVTADIDDYVAHVAVGGLMLFDDYGTANWPDVARAVDEALQRHPELEWLGSFGRTGLARRLDA
jgi:hypothetical protein